jgi:hypothetical protein
VPDPADLSHRVLLRVAEFLRRLPTEQLAELADGEAKLAVVPKGARPAGTSAARPARPPRPAPVTAGQVRAELAAIGDRAAGRRWLEDQRLTIAHLVALARELGIATRAKPRKDEALDQIVHALVGRRLDFESISRPAPPRY